MRAVEVTACALAAIAVVGSVGTATPAYASNYGVELNGTWRVTSNGDWAKTNDVFINEPTVVQTWTMTSSCTSPHTCIGEVRSDQGWTAPLKLGGVEAPGAVGDYWVVDHVVPNWEPCPDGTAGTPEVFVASDCAKLSGADGIARHDRPHAAMASDRGRHTLVCLR